MHLLNLIKKYPVISYYILTFVISWGGMFAVIGPDGFLGTNWQNDAFGLIVMALLVGPTIAGLLLTGIISGKIGLKQLFAGLLVWRAKISWYAVGLLMTPVLILPVHAVLSIGSPIFADNKMAVLLPGIMAGITTILEEIGWTGFAIPRLRRRYNILVTGLIVGILWGLWHLLQMLWVGAAYAGTLSLGFFMPLYILASVAQLTAYRILMVWVYDRTRSLLLATLMHASLTAGTLFFFRPEGALGVSFLLYVWFFAASSWIAVAVVFMAKQSQLLRHPSG